MGRLLRAAPLDMERLARSGATLKIVKDREEHVELDRRFPGIMREAVRMLRTNGAAAQPKKRPRRKLSAEARKKISDAQKARWKRQRREKKVGA